MSYLFIIQNIRKSYIKSAIIIIILLILTTPVLAADYFGRFTVEKVETINGVKTWASPQTFTLNKSESRDYLGMVTIKYTDIDTSSMRIALATSGGVTTSFVIGSGETKNIRGNYYDNASSASIDDIRIKMIELTQYSSSTITNSSDTPIYAYFYTDREWSLRKDDTVTFDAKSQKSTADSGVTYSGNVAQKEVFVYFKRLRSIPVSITVSSKDEPPSAWDNEKLKFTITKSDTYVFTVKYDITNPWGAATETVVKYTLVVTGLETTSTTNKIYSMAPYEVTVGATKTIPMSEPGSFASITGVTITPLNNNTYNLVFAAQGNYNLVYTTNAGVQSIISFNIIPAAAASTAAQPAATVKANQNQAAGASPMIDNMYIGAALLIIVIAIIYMKKKNRGGSGGSNTLNTSRNIG